MKGVCLTLYVNEFDKHEGFLLYEWILEEAKRIGIKGGTAIKGTAGYGKGGHLHEEHFYELGSNVPIHIEFILSNEKADELLNLLKEKKQSLFYAKYSVEYGEI